MRICFMVAGLLLGSLSVAGGVDTLKLPEGATKPESSSHIKLHNTKAKDLALLPPHRMDVSLPKEKLKKQPLFARIIKVDKNIYKVLPGRLEKTGYYVSKMEAREDRETGQKSYQSFLLKEDTSVKRVDPAPLEDLTVIFHWVSKTKALMMITNEKGEYLALKDYKPFVKAFRQPATKKRRS